MPWYIFWFPLVFFYFIELRLRFAQVAHEVDFVASFPMLSLFFNILSRFLLGF